MLAALVAAVLPNARAARASRYPAREPLARSYVAIWLRVTRILQRRAAAAPVR